MTRRIRVRGESAHASPSAGLQRPEHPGLINRGIDTVERVRAESAIGAVGCQGAAGPHRRSAPSRRHAATGPRLLAPHSGSRTLGRRQSTNRTAGVRARTEHPSSATRPGAIAAAGRHRPPVPPVAGSRWSAGDRDPRGRRGHRLGRETRSPTARLLGRRRQQHRSCRLLIHAAERPIDHQGRVGGPAAMDCPRPATAQLPPPGLHSALPAVETQRPAAPQADHGPATVSQLGPGDPGFGWPSTAFGSARAGSGT